MLCLCFEIVNAPIKRTFECYSIYKEQTLYSVSTPVSVFSQYSHEQGDLTELDHQVGVFKCIV